jgi:hypothetical protein
MSPPTPDTPLCVASCSRIELRPSRLAAALWFAWLAVVCSVVLAAGSLPWISRFVLIFSILGSGIRCIRSFVLLAGPKAVRAIEWREEGEMVVRLGPGFAPQPARLAAGSFRLGVECWVLRFETPAGLCPVLIAGGIHDPEPFRRLSRCLTRHLRRASGRSGGPAVTIRPKV